MPDLVAVGKVVGVFGNKGSLRVASLTDFPSRVLELGSVYLVGKQVKKYRVLAARKHRRGYNLTLSGVDSSEKAKSLMGCYVSVLEEELEPLPKGTYYEFQIVGLVACRENGETIGEVTDILELPGNDVLVIDGHGKEILVPLVDNFIKEINIEKKRIIITPIKGLIDQE
ncbi:16S rRNA processing protein RimM [candidate division TA06 bacterium]|uniref:Ribosome maturation factor RimM n=1 Tax=candidate division TA06 bacterium TaxID=2250710 RepID=A0A523URJ7_UNCT6|nr:MAG: 16S rRNA processing protein RimM [candidate division TA06 bacterium]